MTTAKSILIVDDSSTMRRTLAIALQRAGYATTEAENGQQALGTLAGGKFDLIISDVNMPVMDGISFAKAVKQMPTSRFTPIVMLTTESKLESIEQGRAAGVRAWVLKPFVPQQLVDAVARLVQS